MRRQRARNAQAQKPNIKSLIQDEQVCTHFSDVTENILSVTEYEENNVDSVANTIIDGIISASDQTI